MDYRNANFCSITISPPIYRGSQDYIYDQHKTDIVRYLNLFSKHYMLVPEFSLDARLHYHGVILISDFIKYGKVKHKIDRDIGWVKVEKIKDFKSHLRWLCYCKKDHTPGMYEVIRYKSLKRTKKFRMDTKSLDHGLSKFGFLQEP